MQWHLLQACLKWCWECKEQIVAAFDPQKWNDTQSIPIRYVVFSPSGWSDTSWRLFDIWGGTGRYARSTHETIASITVCVYIYIYYRECNISPMSFLHRIDWREQFHENPTTVTLYRNNYPEKSYHIYWLSFCSPIFVCKFDSLLQLLTCRLSQFLLRCFQLGTTGLGNGIVRGEPCGVVIGVLAPETSERCLGLWLFKLCVMFVWPFF